MKTKIVIIHLLLVVVVILPCVADNHDNPVIVLKKNVALVKFKGEILNKRYYSGQAENCISAGSNFFATLHRYCRMLPSGVQAPSLHKYDVWSKGTYF